MALYCSYTKEEVLMIIGEYASKTLPKKDGVLRARLEDDGSVYITFHEDGEDELIDKEQLNIKKIKSSEEKTINKKDSDKKLN